MKVRAVLTGETKGYFGHIRRVNGDVFVIPDNPKRPVDLVDANGKPDPRAGMPVAFSARWMEVVDAGTPINRPSSVKTRIADLKNQAREALVANASTPESSEVL